MKLEHGTEEDHQSTIERAKANGIDNVWTGDIRRNQYLAENLAWAEEEGLIKVGFKEDYDGQASYYLIEYLF